MRSRLLTVVAAFLLAAQAEERRGVTVKTTQPGASSGAQPTDFYALIIGVDTYLHLPRLTTAVNDARALAETVLEHYGFPNQNTLTLYDAEATETNIVRQLRHLTTTLDDDDSLLIFYAGHGHLDDVTGQGAWIPVDGKLDDDTTWIFSSKVKTYLRAMHARHVLLISDSCFSGEFFRGGGGVPEIADDYVRRAFAKRSRQALTSGSLEPVADNGFQGHSIFSSFLLRELRENAHPYLLASELYQRVKGGVAANTQQQPLFGILAETGGEVGGEFVLLSGADPAVVEERIQERRQLLSLLQRRQEEDTKAREKQQQSIAQREAELRELDGKVTALRRQLDDKPGTNEALDQLYAIVKQKEKQAADLEKLRQHASEEAHLRRQEIAQLRREQTAREKAVFQAELAKYRQIQKSSQVSLDQKMNAWRALCAAWSVKPGAEPAMLTWDDATGRAELASGAVSVTVSPFADSRRAGALPAAAELNIDSKGWKRITLPWIERRLVVGTHQFELKVEGFSVVHAKGTRGLSIAVDDERTNNACFYLDPLDVIAVTFRVDATRPAKPSAPPPSTPRNRRPPDAVALAPSLRDGVIVLLHRAANGHPQQAANCLVLNAGKTDPEGKLTTPIGSAELAGAEIHYLCAGYRPDPRQDETSRRFLRNKAQYRCRLAPDRPQGPATTLSSRKNTDEGRACLRLTAKVIASAGGNPVSDAFVLGHCHKSQTCRLVTFGLTDYKGSLVDPLVPEYLVSGQWQISEIVVVKDGHAIGRQAYEGGQSEHTVVLTLTPESMGRSQQRTPIER